jgi:hypothetical protein
MEGVRRGYLYRHIRKDKDEVFYIGIGSSDNYKRAYKKSGRNEIWHRIVTKTEYEVEIMLDNIPFNILKEKEKEFIKIYGKIRDHNGTLSNITDGGDGTLGHSFPSNKKGKKFAEIVKDEKYAEALIHNSKKPFNLLIKEPDKELYTIRCCHRNELFEKSGISVTLFLKLYKRGEITIDKIFKGEVKITRHPFPLGTNIKLVYEKVDKIKIIRPVIKKYKNPFNVIITEPDGEKTTISCVDTKDFFKQSKIDKFVYMKMRKMGECIIKHRQKSTKHLFPIGTHLKMNYLA